MASMVLITALVLTAICGAGRLYPEANLHESSYPIEEWWWSWFSAMAAYLPPKFASYFYVGFPLLLFLSMLLLPFVERTPYRGVRNQLFTMHGSTMIYLFSVPFLAGLALYVLPLMIGSRDVAYPRLTAFGYWTYLFGGIVFYASFLFGEVPAGGWFAYAPLSSSKYTGLGLDFWALGLSLVEISGIVAAVEIVVTILKLRAPGMSLGRMPMFAWAMLAAGLMSLLRLHDAACRDVDA